MKIGLFEIQGNGASLCFNCSEEFYSGYLAEAETIDELKSTSWPFGMLLPFCKRCFGEFVCHDCLHKLIRFKVQLNGDDGSISIEALNRNKNDIPKITNGVAMFV